MTGWLPNRTKLGLAVSLAVLVGAAYAFSPKVRVLTWHALHRSVELQGYEIQVPRNFLPIEQADRSVLLVEVISDRDVRATADLFVSTSPVKDLETWKNNAVAARRILGGRNVESTSFYTDSEKVACVSNQDPIFQQPGAPTVVSNECLFAGGLSLTFVSEEQDSGLLRTIVTNSKLRQAE
jgi:hypothetical protein